MAGHPQFCCCLERFWGSPRPLLWTFGNAQNITRAGLANSLERGSAGSLLLGAAAALSAETAAAQQKTFHLDRLEMPGAPDDGVVLFRPVTNQRTIFFGQLGIGYSAPVRCDEHGNERPGRCFARSGPTRHPGPVRGLRQRGLSDPRSRHASRLAVSAAPVPGGFEPGLRHRRREASRRRGPTVRRS